MNHSFVTAASHWDLKLLASGRGGSTEKLPACKYAWNNKKKPSGSNQNQSLGSHKGDIKQGLYKVGLGDVISFHDSSLPWMTRQIWSCQVEMWKQFLPVAEQSSWLTFKRIVLRISLSIILTSPSGGWNSWYTQFSRENRGPHSLALIASNKSANVSSVLFVNNRKRQSCSRADSSQILVPSSWGQDESHCRYLALTDAYSLNSAANCQINAAR